MKIIIDSNIILSALIKEGFIRNIIVNSGLDFYYPKLSFQELERHRALVLNKSGMNEEEYYLTLSKLMRYIRIISNERISEYLKEAEEIMLNIDPNDVVFIATALSIKDSEIWSDDKHLKQQDKIKVYNTLEMIELIRKG